MPHLVIKGSLYYCIILLNVTLYYCALSGAKKKKKKKIENCPFPQHGLKLKGGTFYLEKRALFTQKKGTFWMLEILEGQVPPCPLVLLPLVGTFGVLPPTPNFTKMLAMLLNKFNTHYLNTHVYTT